MNARNLAKYLMLVLTFMLLTVAVSAQDDAADDGLYTGAELQTTIQEVVNNDTELVGQTVTVEGVVSELVNVRAFTLREDAVIDADGVLVINNTGQPFDLNVTADDRFLVTGIVHNPIEEVYGNEVTDAIVNTTRITSMICG